MQSTELFGVALLLMRACVQSLGNELDRSLSDPQCPSSTTKRNLGLFFSALQSVQPAEDFAPPPPSQFFEPLSREWKATAGTLTTPRAFAETSGRKRHLLTSKPPKGPCLTVPGFTRWRA